VALVQHAWTALCALPGRGQAWMSSLLMLKQSGQTPGKTPARVNAGAGPLNNGPRAPAEGQVVAGTMAQKLTGRSSHPSTNWLTWTYTFLPTGGAPYRAV
jgi:hypothetical protein